jgi:hypothetical protein
VPVPVVSRQKEGKKKPSKSVSLKEKNFLFRVLFSHLCQLATGDSAFVGAHKPLGKKKKKKREKKNRSQSISTISFSYRKFPVILAAHWSDASANTHPLSLAFWDLVDTSDQATLLTLQGMTGSQHLQRNQKRERKGQDK